MEEMSPVERVEMIMGIIAGKWKPAIIYALVMEGPLRFVELRRRIPRVTQRMLTQQLRDLERYGIIKRVHYKEIPPRVEYSVTAVGRSLHPFFKSLCDWGGQHFPALERARLRYDKRANRG
ncbi:MAG TPA: helix-turn-helix domain-containing protein [Thermoanaerobaculia bacterium]|nr:helix-turn-helix domain-containing protein [Thermoanaerobaculia bacterium]